MISAAQPQLWPPLDEPPDDGTLRIFPAQEPDPAQDYLSCAASAPVQGASLDELFALAAAAGARPALEIPAADRPRVRQTYPLWRLWEQYLLPHRLQQLRPKRAKRRGRQISPDTLAKERQVIQRYREWDLQQRPDVAAAKGIRWPGLPVGHLSQAYLERFLRSEAERGLAYGTIKSTWITLRTVLRFAVRLQAIESAPTVDLASVADDDELPPVAYTTSQLQRIYRSLGRPDLQAAWVLGLNCGPRTIDLFGCRWEWISFDQQPAALTYKATKTGKTHRIPLHTITVYQLERLAGGPLPESGLLFPELTAPDNKDPERSYRARKRNQQIKRGLRECGLPLDGHYAKPIQVLRSTCSSRLNNHAPGVGRLVTHGPDIDINSRSYWDSWPLIVEAIATLPMPQFSCDGWVQRRMF